MSASVARYNEDAVASRNTPVFYRPELDILRFGAFVLVFIHHSFPAPPGVGVGHRLFRAVGEGSALGVSLFFLLSSYLITELLIREKKKTASIVIRNFYLRRILRIWPLYFAMLAFATVLGRFNLSQAVPSAGLLAYLLLVGNWWTGLYGFLPVVAGPLWSISVEEQFYLVWPTLVRSAGERAVLLVGAALWMTSEGYLFVSVHFYHVSADWIWVNSLVQFQYFALGIVLAVVLKGRSLRYHWTMRILVAFFGLACFTVPEMTNNAIGFAGVLETRAAMAVFPVAGLGAAALFCSILGAQLPPWSRVFVYFGKISYGLYVFHLAVIVLLLRMLERQGLQKGRIFFVWTIGLAATILLAHLSYRYFEMPFLRLKERFAYIKSSPR